MDWALTGTSMGLIIAFCYLLDWLISKKEEDKQKVAIIKWWSQLDDFNYGRAVRKSNIFCNEIFDKIYGKRLFSLRCVGVSCCVSIISVSILSIATFSISEIYYDVAGDNIAALVFILSTAAMLNTWIDYISLVETRLILRFASRVKPLILPVLLLVDLFLTVIVFRLCVGELERAVVGIVKYSPPTLGRMSFMLVFATLRVRAEPILFYSTFSTSVIFYIYCLSTLVFKFVKLTKAHIMVVLERLEDSDHIFKALGGFLAVVAGLVRCVVELIQHIM